MTGNSRHEQLSPADELELERTLADVQRYPLQLDSEQWRELKRLAKDHDRAGQLTLLRSRVGAPRVEAGHPVSSLQGVPAIVRELLDRIQDAERRAAAAETRLACLEAQFERKERE